MTRILQNALGGNSKTAIICTMTQTLQNYQETVNTLHFGQKAKNVKTKVNVNEISQNNGNSSAELEKANKTISDLQEKIKGLESQQFAVPQPKKKTPIQDVEILMENDVSMNTNNIDNMSQS